MPSAPAAIEPTIPPVPASPAPGPGSPPRDLTGRGLAYGLSAFGWWAVVVPVYFRVLGEQGANPSEILAQRIVFGLPVLLAMLAFRRKFGAFLRAVRTPTALRVLVPSAVLIGVNWYFFIYAVTTERLSHASLGYYINPLFSIALGYVFLGERPRPVQWRAIGLACVAVVVMAYAELTAEESKGFPWISLLLPASFGLYGLLRKRASVGPSEGLTFEMLLLLPLAAGLLVSLEHTGQGVFLKGPGWVSGLMLLGGVVTIVPLICFTHAVRLLPLSTVGLLQYIAPTGQLLLSVLFFEKSFTPLKFAAFAIIWLAVAIYSWDMLRARRSARRPTELLE